MRPLRLSLAVLCGGGMLALLVFSPTRPPVTPQAGGPARPSSPPSPTPSDLLLVQRVSEDPFTNPGGQHRTEVEPDTFADGPTVVGAFQAGRFAKGGGSTAIGFATSPDAGRTWTSGFLPALTIFSSPSGPAGRVSDPSVAHDAVHRVWLIASLRCPVDPRGCGRKRAELMVNRSSNGTSWAAPLLVSAGDYDKSWIVCDNWTSSRFRGTCYASWTDVGGKHTLTSSSLDGGLTWSKPVPGDRMLGVQPVVRPDGTLVITGENERAKTILAIRSTDGGRTFERSVVIATFTRSDRRGFRTEQLPSSEADGAGVVFVSWQDCRFHPRCTRNDIVFSSSPDGRAWSTVVAIPLRGGGDDALLPGLAVDATTSGSGARLALMVYSFVHVPCAPAACSLLVGFLSSSDAGKTWTAVTRLSAQPMGLTWLPRTELGRMAGDYISTSFVPGGVVTLFPLASGPGPRFDQAMFAARIPL